MPTPISTPIVNEQYTEVDALVRNENPYDCSCPNINSEFFVVYWRDDGDSGFAHLGLPPIHCGGGHSIPPPIVGVARNIGRFTGPSGARWVSKLAITRSQFNPCRGLTARSLH